MSGRLVTLAGRNYSCRCAVGIRENQSSHFDTLSGREGFGNVRVQEGCMRCACTSLESFAHFVDSRDGSIQVAAGVSAESKFLNIKTSSFV
jgi:hypothetical protein